MNEREVECSWCDNTTMMIQEDIPSGWIFIDAGWAAVSNMRLCPRCKERYLKHRMIVGECSRKYPDLVTYPCE